MEGHGHAQTEILNFIDCSASSAYGLAYQREKSVVGE
jgi:hypothetical protein